MKETITIILFFLFAGIYSGALNIAMTIIFVTIGVFIIYIAWYEEKKAKIQQKAFIKKRKERLIRFENESKT